LVERREPKTMGRKRKTKEEIDYSIINHWAASWCVVNGYKIYPIPAEKCVGECKNFYLVIQRGTEKKRSKHIYTKIGISNKTWEAYNWIFKKHMKAFYKKHADK